MDEIFRLMKERDEMIEGGFQPASIGQTTLRFETAGIVGLALARAMLGASGAAGKSNSDGAE